jgi:hypothetical protein
MLNCRVVEIKDIFSRYSSESPEKRGIVFSFLILYNSPVNVQQTVAKMQIVSLFSSLSPNFSVEKSLNYLSNCKKNQKKFKYLIQIKDLHSFL